MAPALKRVCDLRLLTRRFQSLLRNECRPLKADSTFPLCFPGTYLPGYLDAAAARLVHGFIPLTVISPSFVTGAEGPLFHRAPLFCAEVPLFTLSAAIPNRMIVFGSLFLASASCTLPDSEWAVFF